MKQQAKTNRIKTMIENILYFAFGGIIGYLIGYVVGKANHLFPKIKLESVVVLTVTVAWFILTVATYKTPGVCIDPLIHGIFGGIVTAFIKKKW